MTRIGATEKHVIINGDYYPKSDFIIRYEGSEAQIFHRSNLRDPLIHENYGSIMNENTGLAFASLSELQNFISENFFFELTGEGTGGEGDTIIYQNNWASTNW